MLYGLIYYKYLLIENNNKNNSNRFIWNPKKTFHLASVVENKINSFLKNWKQYLVICLLNKVGEPMNI